MNELNLREADRLEVTVLIDNYTDMFMEQSSEIDVRPPFAPEKPVLAEHGLSCFIKIFAGSEEHVILMDTGISTESLFQNANALNIDLNRVETVVLSHGHFDHIGGLLNFMNRVSGEIPLALHPEAFLERRINNPAASAPVPVPGLDEEVFKQTGAEIIKCRGPSTLASELMLMTGEVERTTTFENGFPWAEVKINDKWVVDPFNDDQGLVVNLKDKGLVVISGCAHAGIINTVDYARKITKKDKVHAVLGGFHLTGPIFEPIIEPTIKEMKRINPDYVVPMHCTGWNSINKFKEEMPEEVVLNTVGTTYIF